MGMRFIWAGLAGLILFVCLAPVAQAQQVPPGSYLRSCRDAEVRQGRNLVALCETQIRGNFQSARLDDFFSCRGDISNRDGSLVCDRSPPIGQGAGAGGQGSGPGIGQGAGYGYGGGPNSGPPIGQGAGAGGQGSGPGIGQGAGYGYGGGPNAGPPIGQGAGYGGGSSGPPIGQGAGPGGAPGLPFRESCTKIAIKNGVISALCRDRRGQWRPALLNLATCRPGGDIWNRDGILVCDPRAGFGPPPGSYQRSCRNPVAAEGWLAAECRDMQGRWQRSRLNLVLCRGRRDIANLNGQLVCN